LYYPWIYLTSGAERTVVEVSGRSRHDWTLFTNHFDPSSTFPEFADRRVVELPRVSVKRAIGPAAAAAFRVLTQRLRLQGYDALVVVSEGFGDLAVLRSAGVPVLCICLTPLRPVFDMEYRKRATAMRGAGGRAAFAAASQAFKWLDRLAWRRYARVFCISEEVRKRAIAGGLGSPDRLDVLHVGLGIHAQAPSAEFEPFFLVPGRIMWTKNLELAIEAFRRYREIAPEQRHFKLVIAGIVDDKSVPYYARLQQLAAEVDGVEFRVFPTDAELADLYRRCYAVLFTPFNEDWGIVPLEGLAFGKPPIATNCGGPRESIRHGFTGFLEEPHAEAFAQRMAQLARDLPLTRSLGRAGCADVDRYSWDRFTAAIDAALDDVITGRAPEAAASPTAALTA
jgi:glycosyltransferase involved in cell wall biosynthesis